MQIIFKQMGKRRPAAQSALDFPEGPATLRDFLVALVRREVAAYNAREPEQPLLPFLLPAEIQAVAESGKVGFGSLYGTNKADPDQAVATALTAFADGLYAVFWGEKQALHLDDILDIQQDTAVTILRLTLLTGC